jgi:uncharacterized protein (TIGR02145 family)
MIKSVKVKAYLLFVSLAAAMVIGCKKDDSAIKTMPLITWENPADITFGDLLSNTQLNATANVTGTYVYIPASGTKLNVGENQELNVYFTPTDIATYDTASKTVKINVLPAGVSSAIFNPVLTYGILTDVEGNNYKTIAIGSQIWMAENLRTTKYRNGDSIPTVTGNTNWKNLTKAACCTYENTSDKDKIATFGRLYNWFAVSDSRNIAPTGWHVATDADWLELSSFLGNENVAGGKLKETTTKHWNSPNTGASNESGFTALPTGRREYTDGSFINLGYDGFWWTSSAYNPDYSWYRYLHYNVAEIFRANFHKQYGFSVRCVKD